MPAPEPRPPSSGYQEVIGGSMPHYEYHCPSNGRTIEVRHAMDERLATWGQVAGLAGITLDDTPADAPVARLLSLPLPATGGTAPEMSTGCGPGCACARPA